MMMLSIALREWESVGIRLSPLGNATYVACLPLLCQGSKWFNDKSIWLVFRRSWVQIPAGSQNFFPPWFISHSLIVILSLARPWPLPHPTCSNTGQDFWCCLFNWSQQVSIETNKGCFVHQFHLTPLGTFMATLQLLIYKATGFQPPPLLWLIVE